MGLITFAVTGDSFITRQLPDNDSRQHSITELLSAADVRFTNLEVTIQTSNQFPAAESGGAWAFSSPEVLDSLKKYGFNLVAWATNHTLDYSIGGLLETEAALNGSGLAHAGAGVNLAQAGKPTYLDTNSGRVSLIAACSTYAPSARAGAQRSDAVGRPGVNPLGFTSTYEIPREYVPSLRTLAGSTFINASDELKQRLGAKPAEPDGVIQFGSLRFKAGKEFNEITAPSTQDVDRILRSIKEARHQADYVLVSIHSHEMKKGDIRQPADFLVQFAKSCIDAGADGVIGHGPHVLRGIEIYNDRPIFYSLGNFIFQNDTMHHQPADFYERLNLPESANIADLYEARTGNGTRGFEVDESVWASIIPVWTIENGALTSICLYPIDLGLDRPRSARGWPQISKNEHTLQTLKDLSIDFGTHIDVADGVGTIRL